MIWDEAFAEGFRLAWRSAPIGVLTVVLGAAAICLLGYFWGLIEISNAVRVAQ